MCINVEGAESSGLNAGRKMILPALDQCPRIVFVATKDCCFREVGLCKSWGRCYVPNHLVPPASQQNKSQRKYFNIFYDLPLGG